MDKRAKIFIYLITIVLVSGGALAYFTLRKSPAAAPVTDIIFFYGRECPHCQDVEKFLEENKIAEKVRFDSAEVWHNADNNSLLMKKADECGIAEDKIGVPFLYARGKCFIGAPDVENFFRQESAK